MPLKFLAFSFVIFILSSCTNTFNLVNASGEVSDVVDDSASASANFPM